MKKSFILLLVLALFLSCNEKQVGDSIGSPITDPVEESGEEADISISFVACSNDTLEINPLSLPTVLVVVKAHKELANVTFFKVSRDEKRSTSLIKQVISFDSLYVYRSSFTAAQLGLDYQTAAALRVAVEDVDENFLQRQLEFEYVDPAYLAPQIHFTNVADDTLQVNSDPNATKLTPCFTIASANLDSVKLYVLKKSGASIVAQQHGYATTTFSVDQDYAACFENVTYTDDVVGLRVYATTKLGKSATLDLPLKVALDLSAAPIIRFLTGSALRINTHAKATKPYAQFRVTSSSGLTSLKIGRVNYDSDYELGEITSFPNKKDFTYEVKELTSTYFTGLEGVYVEAYDESGKYTRATLPVEKFSADPLLDELSAFPGADGFGRNATGGRGGVVYYVTSLKDDNTAGTLRYAINQAGARTIVFKVSGIIELSSRLRIQNGNLTIAGQTAPGEGICLKGNEVTVDASNVIVRYMRFRMGDINDVESDAFWGRYQTNVILDHCSMSWSVDECSSFYENTDFTMQWCILSESLRVSKHEKGSHGYAAIWGGMRASFHHNILAHHDSRNPRFGAYTRSGNRADGLVDFRNNVIYNWGGNSGYGGEGGSYNMVNNYYQPTPSSANNTRIMAPDPDQTIDHATGQPTGTHGVFYVAGNVMMKADGTVNTTVTNDNWQGVHPNAKIANPAKVKSTTEFNKGTILTHTAQKAYALILDHVGASFRRDVIDTRVLKEVRNREAPVRASGNGGTKAGLIDSQTDVGGWCNLESLPAPLDSDNDGMPDAWEVLNGLNPNDASDRNTKTLSSVYTNLEVYLSSIVVEITDKQREQ